MQTMPLRRVVTCIAAMFVMLHNPAPAVTFPDLTVYSNTFDTPASLAGFTKVGTGDISVTGGQLQVTNGDFTDATAMLNTSTSFGPPYKSTLSQNQGLVTWAFNLANQDATFNNGFYVVLASTHANPYTYFPTQAHGYYFRGGGMLGSRMGLWRFDYGIGGGQEVFIDLTSGLETLPQMGSFRITYNPANNLWSLYGSTGTAYSDPLSVTTLLGSATEATYTSQLTPYFGLGGITSGVDYFDNVTVTVVPEPAAGAMLVLASVSFWCSGRKLRRH